ncbi:hypothetical protein [Nostoc sp. ATCC 53789]|uniref:hypothetical protein n=1 Tax=Nostoc sp. ATCC 53789 TaxID=76335 RepID=UPI00132E7443|nr:hypothetical protein [Nostoc sp. ATCC 53789]QHG21081.1 hypothetical protein GJB62_35110 [Nostoc sp. ATCC 53789]
MWDCRIEPSVLEETRVSAIASPPFIPQYPIPNCHCLTVALPWSSLEMRSLPP